MTISSTKKLTLLLISAALSSGFAATTMAQSASDAAAATAAPSAAQTKAEKKAAKKQAHANKNAELKKLEDAGYNPSQNDPNYPDKLQKAQNKVNAEQGASQ
jgi:Ni/Co efflux regulator RcnB